VCARGTALYDGGGTAVAYIAVNDEFTIYSWGGQPVAYLEAQDAGKFAVYGFNGHHLGWFYQGVIWDHEGNGSCSVKARLQPVTGSVAERCTAASG
jgi:hypothetical protein